MDTTFVNKIIVAFNELISELGDDSVGVCGLKNDGRMTILLGAASPSQLAASIIMNGGTIFSLSDTNPRAIAERMDKVLDEFNAIAQKLDDENVTFDDNFDFKIIIKCYIFITRCMTSAIPNDNQFHILSEYSGVGLIWIKNWIS